MLGILVSAIGVGLVFTLVLTEAFGLAAGGLVVPGYVALKLLQPWVVAITLLAAFATFLVVRALGAYLVIFGRRRTALTILTAYLIGAGIDALFGGGFVVQETAPVAADLDQGVSSVPETAFFELSVIGYIIPGLIALWFDRQGVLATISGLIVTSVLVRLTLVVFMPDALQNYEAQQASELPSWLDFSGGR